MAAPHFMGAVVLEQYPTPTGGVEARSVVDGQQRLTTLQLLLRGVLDALVKVGAEKALTVRISRLVRNDEEVLTGDALYKVWPRPADRGEFLGAMTEVSPAGDNLSTFMAARAYFAAVASDFLTDDEIPADPFAEGEPVQRRAALLTSTLLGLIKLVVIDLDDVDDAQVIFEALNARNTPLSATDLVKNLLFMRVQAQHHDPQEIYDEVWARFDKDDAWWRHMVGVGHAQRARQDWLLGDWLIAQLGRVINVGRLYGEFRQWLGSSGTSPVDALRTLNRYADAYESLHERRAGAAPAEIRAFRVIDQFNITVATPVLLWLLSLPEDRLPKAERAAAFRAIESYVVRRMATKWQTRGYGQAFAEVLKAAQSAPEHPGRVVVAALRAAPHGYSWPSDQDLSNAFTTGRYYGPGGINQDRLRLLLGEVDRRLHAQAVKSEPVSIDYTKLQIEHVIPQEWRKFWPIEADNEAERIQREQGRDSAVHRIGNLTLVSDRLNPSMGQDPWEMKRTQLRKHSHLQLNRVLCESDGWDEAKVDSRSSWLAQQVAAVWPGPDAEAWDI